MVSFYLQSLFTSVSLEHTIEKKRINENHETKAAFTKNEINKLNNMNKKQAFQFQ